MWGAGALSFHPQPMSTGRIRLQTERRCRGPASRRPPPVAANFPWQEPTKAWVDGLPTSCQMPPTDDSTGAQTPCDAVQQTAPL